MYYAHSKEHEPKEKWQSLKEHLEQTADLAASFGDKFGAKELGYTAGLLHDIGKYSREFQKRLEGCSKPVDHSTIGMQEVLSWCSNRLLAKIVGYVICGHHSGLPNSGSINQEGSLEFRAQKKLDYDYSRDLIEVQLPNLNNVKLPLTPTEEIHFSCYLFIKMLYSCLVDADFLDTEYYMDIEKAAKRGGYSSLYELLVLLNTRLEKITSSAEDTVINKHRKAILESCIISAEGKQGFYSLTVPTGGGKTLSSMAFALNHAVKNGLERVIYVIPYTSIIEQNAQVFRDVFGEANILEHHSNYQFDRFETDDDEREVHQKLKLASENWDVPIVVTTNLQFFESLFANRSSKCRKLHNLSKSVIILDEAQMLPVNYLKPSLLALCELVKHYHSTVVLCTATQPNLNSEKLLPKGTIIEEIVDDQKSLYQLFKRTRIKNLGEIDDEQLLTYLKAHDQVLCIVNKREHARRLYHEFKDSGQSYHLSTKMYPRHRQRALLEIRERLKTGQTCKVVATQLIEAGVDVDFPVVYRAMSGIDSIAQAAGRCNREGKRNCSDVNVFIPIEKHAQPPREIEINVSEAKSIFRNYKDPLSIEAINKYFELLYDIKNTDTKEILKEIKEKSRTLDFPFADIAAKYRLIENATVPIIIPEKDNIECERLINKLKHTPYTYRINRKLQPYIVNAYDYEFKKLLEAGGIIPIDKDKLFYSLTNIDLFYDENTGIKCDEADLIKSTLIF